MTQYAIYPPASATISGTVAVTQSTSPWVVSGTVTANAGTGTFAVSAASLPLPSGAATAAKQPALGTAGTASADVLTVQGIASMTALKVDGSAVTQPISGVVSGVGVFTTDQATNTAVFQAEGSIAFGSLTTSYATIFTAGGAMKIIQARNNTNGTISVSMDGGTTTNYVLDPGDAFSLDLKSNGLSIVNATAIQVKYSGSAPTSGSMRVNGVR